ncbi:MAG: hypothetical protein ACTSUO_05670 [Candidatus Thorarchaeota archaeon]
MNFRILFKSMKFAFRAKKRVIAFIVIYAVLIITVSRALTSGTDQLLYLGMAFLVATVYAILISQFRRRDIAILKCVSWSNSDILLLLIGEVVLVATSAFLVIFQLSVELLGLVAYLTPIGDMSFLNQVRDLIAVDAGAMATTLFYIIILQIPGLVLAQYRAMKIPPMRALRED